MSATKPKILVIRGGAIGDFILTLPALAALRAQFPQAYLEVLGYPHIVQLAIAGGLADRAQPIEARALAAFFAVNGDLSPDMMDYFSEFDLIVSYLYDPDEHFLTNLRRATTAQYIAAPHRPDEKEKTHATKVYLKPLERLAIFEPDSVPRLSIPESGRADLPGWSSSFSLPGAPATPDTLKRELQLALHPGSGSESKNWPEAKWFELGKQLIATTKYDLLLIGGEAEGDRLKRLAATLPSARCKLAQSLPLVDLARQLQTCAGFVGHDSGITHLAAALGLPCLVLWAGTIEEIWRPQGKNLVIAREEKGIHVLSVERVLGELRRLAPAI